MRKFALALLIAVLLSSSAEAMQRRQQWVVDNTGRHIPGASVTVYAAGTTNKATIYSGNGVTVKANPITVDASDGSYVYYAANGRYDETVTAANFTFSAPTSADVVLFDPADSVTTGNLTVAGTLTVQSTGPHAIGNSADPRIGLYVLTTAVATAGRAVSSTWAGVLTATGNGDILTGIDVATFGGFTYATGSFTGLTASAVTISGIGATMVKTGTGTIATASLLTLDGPPTIGTTNYALWIKGGLVRADGGIALVGTPGAIAGPSWVAAGSFSQFSGGTVGTAWNNQVNNAELMRLTDGGVLLIRSTVTGSANGGDIVLPYSGFYRASNNAGSTATGLIGFGTVGGVADTVNIAPGNALAVGTPASMAGAGAGDLVLANANAYRVGNGAGNGTIRIAEAGPSDSVAIGATPSIIRLGNPQTVTGAAAGETVVANSKFHLSANNANSGMVAMIGVNTSDQVILANAGGDIKWGRANIALGGGAAPTVGTIGGAGPAAAAQRNWLRIIESDGTASFIPVWR